MSTRHFKSWLLVPVALLLAVPALWAQDNREFHWKGKLPADGVFQVKGINGNIDAQRAAGDEAEVTVDISGTYADEVKIQVIPDANGVLVCEVYRNHDSCSGHSSDHNRDRTKINYHVRVPANARFHGQTVNGSVTAENLNRSIKATSVNGSVRVSTKSWAQASSVNGSVVATMGSTDWPAGLHISSVNGSVTVALPPDANIDLSVSSINGRFSSELPVTTQNVSFRHLSGHIGNGGQPLHISTVNGSVEIRKNLI
ncbi:MAG TPA: DUF4097 family beta strand repeat-containing protein [Alphaproteobacteria bacterium]|nr:DUF4097 family beta strand repeat-containing protein [Alphaproteobacteria bacterium]